MIFFKSSEEKKVERNFMIRSGIKRMEKAVREQEQYMNDFIINARKAKAIGDDEQGKTIRNMLKKTMRFKRALERQLLSAQNALIVKKQAETTADFTKSMNLMATEIARMFGETDLVKTQTQWQKAMTQSKTMEERMDLFLESIEEVANADVEDTEGVSDEEVDGLISAEDEAEKTQDDEELDDLADEIKALKGSAEGQK